MVVGAVKNEAAPTLAAVPDRFQSGGSPTSARAESDSEAETELPEVEDLELSSRSEDRRGASSHCCRR